MRFKKNAAFAGTLLILGAWQSTVVASTTDILYDNLFNVNGTLMEGSFGLAGLNSSGFNTTTGEGTLVFTYAPGAAGSYYFLAWFDNDLSAPNFNEYGAVNGAAASNQTWQIGDPTAYYNSGLPPGGLGSGVDVVDNTALNTLSNTNDIPGNTDNFLGNCTGSTCNGDVSMAMGFSFTLAANQEEIITLNLTETAPTSGFYLQQIHPVDGCDPNGQNCANPAQMSLYFDGNAVTQGGGQTTPEPGTWMLLLSSVASFGIWRSRKSWRAAAKVLAVRRGAGLSILMLLALVMLAQPGQAAVTVLTVPWYTQVGVTGPHTTYNVCSDGTIPNYTNNPPTCAGAATLTEATIRLGATAILPNTTDTYTGVWNFGDGSSNFTFTVSNSSVNNYDVSTTHQYPATSVAGVTWNAVLTITDNVTHVQGNATYPVIQEQDTLSSRVNVAIDNGLWFEHANMWRGTTTVSGNTVNWGGWDSFITCTNSNICGPYGGLDANFLQAFEVNLHYPTGSNSDPFTDDVQRALARVVSFLVPESPTYLGQKAVNYNPAVLVDRCSDGSTPNFSTTPPTCTNPATLIQYNPGATSCTAPPCNFTFDLNTNGQILVPGNDDGQPGYEAGMYVDALVASNDPTGTAAAGATAVGALPGVFGQTYQNIVTDLVDGILYCQYYGDPYDDTSSGYDAGGAWQYNCAATSAPNYNDNSVSQWNAVGLIAAQRGFGVSIPKITTDTNQVWVTYSQTTNTNEGTFGGIANGNSLVGAFGYYQYAYEPWGPFAVTPSGMVQMAMDGVGRTAANSSDQRWNIAESFYHDNFCYNSAQNYPANSNGYYYDPLYYTYGMFSFSKSMLLHDPGGVLSPIVDVEDEPAGTNPIDWYGALTPANGGPPIGQPGYSPCDGFAQTLVSRQLSDGHWGYPSYYDENSTQSLFETPWALIILRGTVFVACINNVNGKGKPAIGTSPATVTLTWSHQPNATGYGVLRKSSPTGTFTQIGTTTSTVFVDKTSGLTNGSTYYYAVNPLQGTTAICQSNIAVVTVPKGH